MLEVYSFATLTVAATASRNADGGLFFTRSPLYISPCRIHVEWGALTYHTLIAYHAVDSDGTLEVEQGPLNKRAWALQERLLSPRVLHCAERQLHWECCCLEAREIFPNGVMNKLHEENKILSLDRGKRANSPAWETHWSSIRERFRSTGITVDTDRLAAIAGIARRMHEIRSLEQDFYLAGLDRSHLATEITWVVDPTECSRPEKYCAPTWSWASTKGKVTFASDWDLGNENCVEILEARTTPIGDPYGQVSGGYLRLSGMLCEVILSERVGADELPLSEMCPDIEAAWFRDFHFDVQPDSHWKKADQGRALAQIYWDGDNRDTLTRFDGFSFHFLLLRWKPSLPYGKSLALDPICKAYGLLLKQTCKRRGEYQRVGMLTVRAQDLHAVLRRACRNRALPRDAYKDRSHQLGDETGMSDVAIDRTRTCSWYKNTLCEVHLRDEHAASCGYLPGNYRYTIEII